MKSAPQFVTDYRRVIDGVVVAYLQDREEIERTWAILNDATLPPTSELSYPWDTPSRAGDYVMASQSAKVLPADRYEVRFLQRDDFGGPTAGYHYKQLLVDGAVAWEEDVAGGSSGWRKVAVDVTERVRGKTGITLAFRLLDKKGVSNFGVQWCVKELRGENLQLAADLSELQKWTATRRGAFETGFGVSPKVGQRRFHIPFISMTAGSPGEFRHAARRPGHARANRSAASPLVGGVAGGQMRRRCDLLPGQAARKPGLSPGAKAPSGIWRLRNAAAVSGSSGRPGSCGSTTFSEKPNGRRSPLPLRFFKSLGRDLYCILATWDLTSLEVAILANRCPPEDCDGMPGYLYFLRAIRNSRHEQHDELLEWVGGEFDSEEFDFGEANELLKDTTA